MISRQFLFLFSALGAVNGLLLAAYFFSRRPRSMANVMLGALLLAIGVRTAKSTFYFFNRDLPVEYLQLGLSSCLLIGPLTYLYVHYHLAELAQRDPGRHWRRHLALPALVIVLGLFFPYSAFRRPWQLSSYGLHLYWFLYLLAAGWQLRRSQALLYKPDGRLGRSAMLVLSVYFSSCLILAAYLSTPATSYIVGALSLTFSIHITILAFLFRNDTVAGNAVAGKKEKYQNRKLSEADALALQTSLQQIMTEQQLYLNPNLSLAMLAKKIGSASTTVSQVLNDHLHKSFNLYVNEFRIQAAKALLMSESQVNMDLVAERSGFNSSSTFFAAFKKLTGQTPASYRAALAPRQRQPRTGAF